MQMNRPAIFGFGAFGGYSAVSDLNDDGSVDFKTGYDVGGGLGVMANQYVAVRGDFDFARSAINATGTLSDLHVNRYFVGGDVAVRYPFSTGLAPYVFGGAGAIRIDDRNDNAGFDAFTKGAGRFGIGLNYDIKSTGLALFSEGTGLVYKFDKGGFDKTQFDIGWHGGLSYHVHI